MASASAEEQRLGLGGHAGDVAQQRLAAGSFFETLSQGEMRHERQGQLGRSAVASHELLGAAVGACGVAQRLEAEQLARGRLAARGGALQDIGAHEAVRLEVGGRADLVTLAVTRFKGSQRALFYIPEPRAHC